MSVQLFRKINGEVEDIMVDPASFASHINNGWCVNASGSKPDPDKLPDPEPEKLSEGSTTEPEKEKEPKKKSKFTVNKY